MRDHRELPRHLPDHPLAMARVLLRLGAQMTGSSNGDAVVSGGSHFEPAELPPPDDLPLDPPEPNAPPLPPPVPPLIRLPPP